MESLSETTKKWQSIRGACAVTMASWQVIYHRGICTQQSLVNGNAIGNTAAFNAANETN
jgi:hypothetical protein